MWRKIRESMKRKRDSDRKALGELENAVIQALIDYFRIESRIQSRSAEKALKTADVLEEFLAARRQARITKSS
jgi:hypothetical protein